MTYAVKNVIDMLVLIIRQHLNNFIFVTFTIIIVNYNAGNYLKECLNALCSQTYKKFSVILVDNHSEDNSCRYALEESSINYPLSLIRLQSNIGFAAANNLAAKEAQTEYIITLNPDAFPAEDWLEKIADAVKKHPSVDMFGSTQVFADNPSKVDGFGDSYSIYGIGWRSYHKADLNKIPDSDRYVIAPCAAGAVYRRDKFIICGGFDEDFFCYAEDLDLGIRMHLLGSNCIQVRSAIIKHVGSGVTGRRSSFTVYHGLRNQFWIFFKNTPSILLPILIPFFLSGQLSMLVKYSIGGCGKDAFKAYKDALLNIKLILRKRKSIQKLRKISLIRYIALQYISPISVLLRK